MRRITTFLTALCVCSLSGVSLAQLPSQPFLLGVWEGTMTVVEDKGGGSPIVPPYQGEQFPFRLDIKNTNLVMYFRTADGWVGIGEGSDLRLNQEGRSAIVVASLPAGELSETWMVNVARWDEQNITVYLSRVTSADEKSSKPPVSFGAIGQMQRVAGNE